MSSLAEVRLAMMESFQSISGVVVPMDPLPEEIEDKTIIVFPDVVNSRLLSRGKAGSLAIIDDGRMQIEYHRRIAYRAIGSVMGDVSTMIDTIADHVWGELAGGRFDGTVHNIEAVNLAHFGGLGWNEWTFGARLMVSFTYLTEVTP